MRDRQQVPGGISQQDVLALTCPTNPPNQQPVNNIWTNKNVQTINTETFVPLNQQKNLNQNSNPQVNSGT